MYNKNLPELCFYKHNITGETIMLRNGEKGYIKPQPHLASRDPQELNDEIEVTRQEASAMYAGSMFGWHVPATNVDFYDENGENRPPEEIRHLLGK